MITAEKRPPLIAHLTSVHPAFDNRIFDRECRSLAARGYSVTLIAPHCCDETIDHVRILAVPKPLDRRHRIFHVVPAIYRRAVEEDADLYHFHDPELIPMALLLRRRSKKVVYDVHEDYSSSIRSSPWLPFHLRGTVSWCFKHIECYALRRFSGLIGANSEIERQIVCFNPLTITIGNYPALTDYPFGPSFDKTRYSSGALVSFGGISSRTCTRAIVEALGLIPHAIRANLTLGGREFSDALFCDITHLPGWSRVAYVKELPIGIMLHRLLTASIAFVLFSPEPNHFGVGSNRFFEALAAGLPVIASNFPNWKELVNRIGCGITVDPTDPRAIAEAVVYLLSHPTEAAEMGRRAHEIAKTQFNWERESCKLHELYKHLLDGNSISEPPICDHALLNTTPSAI
jgi:glycosyltransferase involved in cell wall biosynthesis